MGGKVPLGYDVRGRKLAVDEAEAGHVRRVLELFAEAVITGVRDEPLRAGTAPHRRPHADGPAVKPNA